MEAVFAAARVTLTIVILLYSSWSDYKTREVANRVWIIYAPIALLLTLVELVLFAPSGFLLFGICFGLTSIFAIVLFYTGAFGGADSKALMCISLAMPFFPSVLFAPLLKDGISPLLQILFPMTVLSNGVLFAAGTGIYMLFRNVVSSRAERSRLFEGTLAKESIGKKLLVLITGHKFTVTQLQDNWHIYPLEDIEDKGEKLTRKLIVVPKEEGRDTIVKRLANAISEGKIKNRIWATPGLPMLIFITAGLIIALLFGDIVWSIINFIMG